jgi:hypothetical protein
LTTFCGKLQVKSRKKYDMYTPQQHKQPWPICRPQRQTINNGSGNSAATAIVDGARLAALAV